MKETEQEVNFIDNGITFGDRTFGIEERDSINEYSNSKENNKAIN